MPEIRYSTTYTYPPGMPAKSKMPANATIKQMPYEVSDEELAAERNRAEITNEIIIKGFQAYNNWGALTSAQKDNILKQLLWYVLVREGKL